MKKISKDKSIRENIQLMKFSELVQMENVDGLYTDIKNYLGVIDADKEWNDNPEAAYMKFVHTKSYTKFIDEESLILLGRTGTGKTAILRCLCENVNKGKISEYTNAILVPFDDILYNILHIVDDFNQSDIKKQLTMVISYYINCFVMKSLVEINGNNKTSAMYRYLNERNLLDIKSRKNSIAERIEKMIIVARNSEGVKNSNIGTVANGLFTIVDIINSFSENGYEDAYNEMVQALETKKTLVLIDTLNEYDMRDIKIVLSVKALIATCFQYYIKSSLDRIYVKISIPSEIHTHIVEQLPGKQQGNTVVVQWTNNDLIRLIAIRLLYLYKNDQSGILRFDESHDLKDYYEKYDMTSEKAKALIHEFLPKSCPTSLNYTFDTIAYTIRHTLKKPRELMTIFNYFVAKIYDTKNFKYFIENPNEIRDMIHTAQDDLIRSALSMYTTSYSEITRACEIVLSNQNYFFEGKEIDNRLKEAVINRDFDADDIKRILLESGLVGKINSIKIFKAEEQENAVDYIRVVEAKFEYQIKGRLSLNRDDYYVIHPMCYEHFYCKLDMHSLVYPDALGNDDELIKNVKIKEWLS